MCVKDKRSQVKLMGMTLQINYEMFAHTALTLPAHTTPILYSEFFKQLGIDAPNKVNKENQMGKY